MDSNRFTHRGHALRKGRVSEPGRAYLLTAVTLVRKPIFQDWTIGRLVVAEMRRLHEANDVRSLAWVVMPDHLHWLVQLEEMSLDNLLVWVKAPSAISINRHCGTKGRIWQKGFHDRALRREEGLHAVARYIVANPLRAGLVSRIGDYPLWDAAWL